jgi:hypothetical protein
MAQEPIPRPSARDGASGQRGKLPTRKRLQEAFWQQSTRFSDATHCGTPLACRWSRHRPRWDGHSTFRRPTAVALTNSRPVPIRRGRLFPSGRRGVHSGHGRHTTAIKGSRRGPSPGPCSADCDQLGYLWSAVRRFPAAFRMAPGPAGRNGRRRDAALRLACRASASQHRTAAN